jgi:microcystin degradation protein MlrC
MGYQLITGGIAHESNTFSNSPTTLADFQRQTYAVGNTILDESAGRGVIGGFMEVAARNGVELLPTLHASTTPKGPVTREAFDHLFSELLARVEGYPDADGAILALHGAMVVEGIDDAEGFMLREIRTILGPEKPIVTVLDLHANLTQEMIDYADCIVGYDTYPHVDQMDRGREAMRIILRILEGAVKPATALVKPPIIPPLQGFVTFRANGGSRLVARAHEMEQNPHVINVSTFGCFPFADTPITGLGLLVNTNDDPALAKQLARDLAAYAWTIRDEFLVKLVDPPFAINVAMQAPGGTFILADIADTGAGGTAGDGTVILQALLKQGAQDVAVAQIADQEAVDACIAKGVGATVTLKVGGKQDRFHGAPVDVTGIVRHISDGTYIRRGPQSPGEEERMGPTVVLEVGGRHGIDLMLTSHRAHPADLQHFRSVGIEPTDKRILVLKSAAHYRAAFGPIATEVFEVDAPGICHPYLERFTWKRLRRPIWPLDTFERTPEFTPLIASPKEKAKHAR